MPTVFVSYYRADKERADQIANGLRNRELQVVGDFALMPGEDWNKKLSQFLNEADVFIFIISASMEHSKWMISEMGATKALLETGKKVRIIPVVFDGANLPPMLQEYNAIFASDDKISEVVDGIATSVEFFISVRATEAKEQEETHKRIEENASTYIQEAMDFLGARERTNKAIANVWYSVGILALIAGVVVAGFYTRDAVMTSPAAKVSWPWVVFLSIRGLVIIGLLVAVSKYAFNLGKAFMSEGLRNSDRIHAISFGRFYLRAFSEKVTWEQLKEVFQTWNIESNTSFSKLEANDYDPKFLQAVVSVAKAVGAKEEKTEAKTGEDKKPA